MHIRHSIASLFGSDSEALPDGGLLEVTGAVVFLQLVSWGGPTKSVVRETGKTTVWHGEGHSESSDEAHVRDSVENEKTLSEHREVARASVTPQDTGAIEGCNHEQVTTAELSKNITHGGLVDLDREGRTLEGAIDVLSGDSAKDHSD